MPVVVNEFEVLPAPTPGNASPMPASEASASEPEPRVLEQLLRQRLERLERVRAR